RKPPGGQYAPILRRPGLLSRGLAPKPCPPVYPWKAPRKRASSSIQRRGDRGAQGFPGFLARSAHSPQWLFSHSGYQGSTAGGISVFCGLLHERAGISIDSLSRLQNKACEPFAVARGDEFGCQLLAIRQILATILQAAPAFQNHFGQ